MKLSILSLGRAWACLSFLTVCALAPGDAAAQCTISGPTSVSVNEAFTLCGPTGGGYTYSWSGPGLTSRSQCMNIDGLEAGSYEFNLTTWWNGANAQRCRHTVTVGSGAGGQMQCSISGPSSIEPGSRATLCAPQSSVHSYRWTGPDGFTASTRCITAQTEGRYTVVIRNALTGYTRECSQYLDAAGTSNDGSDTDCGITGPTTISDNSTAQLCGPAGDVTYRWTGPRGFVSSSRCVEVGEVGTYRLTTRDRYNGRTATCNWVLEGANIGSCDISGPVRIEVGGRATLCATSVSNADYLWSGPNGFRATTRCINATRAGVYSVAIRDRSTGQTLRCDQRLAVGNDDGIDNNDDVDDADQVVQDNCPRTLSFWAREFSSGGSELSAAELRAVARGVDDRSTAFNWSDDAAGLRQALQPARPITNRKQLTRQLAALLANVAAGQAGVQVRDGSPIALQMDTPLRFRNARTVGELVALTERMLKAGRGNFSALAQALTNVNSGRGIGTVCD